LPQSVGILGSKFFFAKQSEDLIILENQLENRNSGFRNGEKPERLIPVINS
jgi:hypothetical protein